MMYDIFFIFLIVINYLIVLGDIKFCKVKKKNWNLIYDYNFKDLI